MSPLPKDWRPRLQQCYFNARRLRPTSVEWLVDDQTVQSTTVDLLGFHGTPEENLPVIRVQGLEDSPYGHLGSGVYLASHIEQAVEYCVRHTYTGAEKVFKIFIVRHRGRGDYSGRVHGRDDTVRKSSVWTHYRDKGHFEMCVPKRHTTVLGILTLKGVRPKLDVDKASRLEELMMTCGTKVAKRNYGYVLHERPHSLLFQYSRQKTGPHWLRSASRDEKCEWFHLWRTLFQT